MQRVLKSLLLAGNQPPGRMAVSKSYTRCHGFDRFNTIVIQYNFSDGIQKV